MSTYINEIREKLGHDLLALPGVTGIVRNSQGHILLVKQSDGQWSTPGGAIEPGESPDQAVRRELKEETGLVTHASRIIGAFGGPDYKWTYSNGDQVIYTLIVFDCTVTGGHLRPDHNEVSDVRYFSPEEIKNLYKPAWLNEVLRAAL